MKEPTHGELMVKLVSVEIIAQENKTRLDELAGAGKFGRWFLVFMIGIGSLGITISKVFFGD